MMPVSIIDKLVQGLHSNVRTRSPCLLVACHVSDSFLAACVARSVCPDELERARELQKLGLL